MVKIISPVEIEDSIVEFLDSLTDANIEIPSKRVVKDEILREIISSDQDFDFVTYKYNKHEAKVQFAERGFDALIIRVEEYIPM
jgi:hypothetical protein